MTSATWLSFEQDDDRVTLHTGAEPIRADWVVGCDGARSTVRTSAGIDFPGVPLVEGFLLADVRADLPLARDAAVVWLRGEEMFGAFPLPGGVWRFMAPAPEGAVDDVRSTMARLIQERAGLSAAAIAGWTGRRSSASTAGSPATIAAAGCCWPGTPRTSTAPSAGKA